MSRTGQRTLTGITPKYMKSTENLSRYEEKGENPNRVRAVAQLSLQLAIGKRSGCGR